LPRIVLSGEPQKGYTSSFIMRCAEFEGVGQLQTRRYETLDALRGVAALAVVVFHLGQYRLAPQIVPNGLLAVDFFFVLSGFVVAHAYEAALLDWLSPWAFFVKRVIRLYPLALLGAAAGMVVLLLKWHSVPDKVDGLPQILLSGLFNGLMLPTFFGGDVSRHELFPGNGPLWSLFFEMLINVLWACFGVRMRTGTIVAVTLVSGAALMMAGVHFQTLNIGFDIATFWGGLARVCFGFPLGVLIFRLHDRFRIPSISMGSLILGLALIAVFISPADRGVPLWGFVSVLIVLPAIVVLGVGQHSSGRIGALLGALSYPVYVLHFPVLLIASGLHNTALSWLNVHVLASASVLIALLLSWVSLRLYDEPVRRALVRFTSHSRKQELARSVL
jgi:peptidoglycan/LPS O-acetylase OafA/YrhL